MVYQPFNTLAAGTLLGTIFWAEQVTYTAIIPEKKEDTTMFPTYTVKSAGTALQGTPFQYWHFLFKDDSKKPLQGFACYYDALDRRDELQKLATESFARKLLRTEAMKDVANVAYIDTKVVETLVAERKDADAILEAETKKLAKKAKSSLFVKAMDNFDDDDYYV